MSAAADIENVGDRTGITIETVEDLVEAARENPLRHPLFTSLALMDYEEYVPPPHLRELMHSVYRSVHGDEDVPKRLARVQPRDHGKSEIGSHLLPSWAALRNPNIRVIIIMEAETKAKEKLHQCRNTIRRWGPRFGRQIEKDSAKNLELRRSANHAEPTIAARGMDSKITGGHYDLLVFDDIVSWETQRTEQQRRKRWNQFQNYQQNLGSAGESTFLVLGTRKHRKDLYSRLVQSPSWDVRVQKAISDYSIIENGEYTVRTDAGNEYTGDELSEMNTATETVVGVEPHRDVDVLWGERWSLAALIEKLLTEIQDENGSTLVFKRENQNDPRVMEGQVLSQDMLRIKPRSELPDAGLRLLAGVDVAAIEDAEAAARGDSDWWAVAVLADHAPSDKSYLLDVERRRGITMSKAIDWIHRTIAEVEQDFGLDLSKALVESNNTQRWLVQEARDKGMRWEQTTSTGSKEERIVDMATLFETGKVIIIDDALAEMGDIEDEEARRRASQKWQSYMEEWAQFPTGAHDDRLDATEISLRATRTENIEQSDYDMSDLPT